MRFASTCERELVMFILLCTVDRERLSMSNKPSPDQWGSATVALVLPSPRLSDQVSGRNASLLHILMCPLCKLRPWF